MTSKQGSASRLAPSASRSSRRLVLLLLVLVLVPFPPPAQGDLPVVTIAIDAPERIMADEARLELTGRYHAGPAGVPLATLHASVDGASRGSFRTAVDGTFSHLTYIGGPGDHTVTLRDPVADEESHHDIFVVGRPGPVQDLTASVDDTTSLATITWSPPLETYDEPVERYELYFLEQALGKHYKTVFVAADETETKEYVQWNVTSDIHVYARTAAGRALESPTVDVTLGPAPPPSEPNEVALVNATYSDRPMVTWSPPSEVPVGAPIEHYLIYAQRGTSDYRHIDTVRGDILQAQVGLVWEDVNTFHVVAEHEFDRSGPSANVSRDLGALPTVAVQADRIRACTGYQFSYCTVVAPGSTVHTDVAHGTMMHIYYSGALEGDGGPYGPLPLVTHAEGLSCTDTGCAAINETTTLDSGSYADTLYELTFDVPPHGDCATVRFDLVVEYRHLATGDTRVELTVCHDTDDGSGDDDGWYS